MRYAYKLIPISNLKHIGLEGSKTMKLIVSGVSVLLLSLIYIAPAQAKPSVVWSPQNVTQEIIVGDSHSVVVELQFLEDARNLNLQVVPELEDVLEIFPDNFSFVQAGEVRSITLNFSIPSSFSDAILDGVVQARSGRRALAKPLPIVLSIVENPLHSTDHDGDGTWDDIQGFIDESYGDNTPLRNGAIQFAHGLQNAVVNADDKAESLSSATEMQRAIECLFSVEGESAHEIRKELLAAFLNSDERARAYMVFSNQLGGAVFPSKAISDLSSSCSVE